MLNLEINTEEEEKQFRSLSVELENISEKNKKILTNNQFKEMLNGINLDEINNIEVTEKVSSDEIKDTDPWSGKIVQNDSKSLAAKKFSEAYTTNNLASVKSFFTDDAKFYINDSKLRIVQMMDGFSQGHEYFDNIEHSDDLYTTMYYNNDSIFTNMWYTWSANSKKTGKKNHKRLCMVQMARE